MSLARSLALVWMVGGALASNVTLDESCGLEPGPWSALLEAWATAPSAHTDRHGRIMALPPANGYYVTERIDGPFMPPPPPIHQPAHHGPPAHFSGSPAHPPGPPQLSPGSSKQPPGPPPRGASVPHSYNEWDGSPSPGGKIVNRPPNPYKDKFKPSYAPPSALRPGAADRVDSPPGKQVSETDLYLLSAIEKLVYRADLAEKRLRRLEQSVHELIAGMGASPEPCPSNFTRVGSGCYSVSPAAAGWQAASGACRKQRAALLELLEPSQRRALLSHLLADPDLRGNDFWTGGLNPGLLWIWSHSARPVAGDGANSTVAGEGRCLALVHDPAAAAYTYRGVDCARALRYICQKDEDKEALSNKIEKAARSLRLDGRKAKLLWEVSSEHTQENSP